ncbi:hypothetical protein NIES4106_06510 [Fischerella sp. NIES-4106]|nr:hypothetical protein NIES4106_06510 [Fischerella sp. NIES-4106]
MQLCSNQTISDQIKCIFFKLLVAVTEFDKYIYELEIVKKKINEREIEQIIIQEIIKQTIEAKIDAIITRIDATLKYQAIKPQALINDLLKDAKII